MARILLDNGEKEIDYEFTQAYGSPSFHGELKKALELMGYHIEELVEDWSAIKSEEGTK